MDQAGYQGASLLDAPTLVVKQKLKLVELNNEYGVFDPDGQRIGQVAQVNQTPLALLARVFSDLDVYLPVHLEVRDARGPVLRLEKPWFTRKVTVLRADGTPLGSITKQYRIGRARFSITDPSGTELGEVQARNWRAKDFAIVGANGEHVAEVTKKWAGLREFFSDADTYVVQVNPGAREPLRSLAIASCLTIDTIMKQKDE